jgi:CBS domain-containing protein
MVRSIKRECIVDNTFLAQSVGLLNPKALLTIPDNAPVIEAVRLLQKNKIGCVVVVDGQGKISGIFSERDVILRLLKDDLAVANEPVAAFMTPHPQMIEMTSTIAYALNLMCAGGYRHLPITDEEGYPVGIISVKNILDHIAHMAFAKAGL